MTMTADMDVSILPSLVAPRKLHGNVWPDEGVARVQGRTETLFVPNVHEERQQVLCQGRVSRLRRRVDGILPQESEVTFSYIVLHCSRFSVQSKRYIVDGILTVLTVFSILYLVLAV